LGFNFFIQVTKCMAILFVNGSAILDFFYTI